MRYVIAERITSQKDCPVILYPKNYLIQPPLYNWQSPNKPAITAHSFHCRGQGGSLSTPEGILYDCEGLRHSITQEVSRYIHPKLIEMVRLLQQDHPKLTIIEAFCCSKHFRFLEASGIFLSQGHLQGTRVLLNLNPPLPTEEILQIPNKLYKKKSDPHLTQFTITESTMSNQEVLLTWKSHDSHTEISLEILHHL
ncbi:hypothetical protein C10C_0541 [Chlamydia serpentis]|uniref:Uncharacterized protein n=2 Tax=Chlamydia serpentis TaxID=1967782 RepID=A0A2R8FBK3_9CHLA|nr:hypothetical protein C10C_0541 [Chlamydia serpentis]